MRDPNRIPRLLEAVRLLWDENPDWRLGQLIVNATRSVDPFYVEDTDILKALRSLRAVPKAEDSHATDD